MSTNKIVRSSARSFMGRLRVVGLWAGLLLVILLSVACNGQEFRLVEISNLGTPDPGTLSVPVGATVVWHNTGRYRQNVVFDPELARRRSQLGPPPGAEPWTSGWLYPGESWTHTFDEPGTYLYFSLPDESHGSMGVIYVGGEATPAGESPPAEDAVDEAGEAAEPQSSDQPTNSAEKPEPDDPQTDEPAEEPEEPQPQSAPAQP